MFHRTTLSSLLVALAFFFLTVPLPAQTFIHVDDDAPGDPGPGDPAISDPLEDGSVVYPFDAIQEAIDSASHGVIVLLANGLYTGPGNHDLSFLGKKITVRSANGPENCTVDCEGIPGVDRFGFEFVNGEGATSILQGLTITGASSDEGAPGHAHGVYVEASSPTISGNVVTGCTGGAGIGLLDSGALIAGNSLIGNSSEHGGGIWISGGSPLIIDNRIEQNSADLGGGIYAHQVSADPCAPLIEHNVVTGNHADVNGGGICLISAEPASLTNNLLVNNHAELGGGGFYALDLNTDSGVVTLGSCTIAGNSTGVVDSTGGGVCLVASDSSHTCTADLLNCILADNQAEQGENLWLGSAGASFPGGVIATLDHCLIKDATTTIRVGHMTLIQASPVLTGDPLFTTGPGGDHYLGQTTDGQAADSPGLDAGSDLAMNICTDGGGETICLSSLSTRTTGVADTGLADLGFHYPAASGTVSASMGCAPSTGILPFSSQFSVSLTNLYAGQTRRIAGRINVLLAGGQAYSSWRVGYTNVGAGEGYLTTWAQSFPAIASLVGDNLFTLIAEDVTPAPYNSPPYPPAGDISTATCTVAGVAP